MIIDVVLQMDIGMAHIYGLYSSADWAITTCTFPLVDLWRMGDHYHGGKWIHTISQGGHVSMHFTFHSSESSPMTM